jgi:hypothetical protein
MGCSEFTLAIQWLPLQGGHLPTPRGVSRRPPEGSAHMQCGAGRRAFGYSRGSNAEGGTTMTLSDRRFRRLLAVVTATSLILVGLPPLVSCSSPPPISEFDIPTFNSQPAGITAGPDGKPLVHGGSSKQDRAHHHGRCDHRRVGVPPLEGVREARLSVRLAANRYPSALGLSRRLVRGV